MGGSAARKHGARQDDATAGSWRGDGDLFKKERATGARNTCGGAAALRCAFGPNTTTALALSPTRTACQGRWQLPGGQEHACMHVIHQPPPYPPPSLHSPTDPSHPVVGCFLSTPQDTSISAAWPCWTWRISNITPSGSHEHAQTRCFPQFHFSSWPVLERRLQHHQDTSHFRVSFTRQRQLCNPS